jgi:hypothetical protein
MTDTAASVRWPDASAYATAARDASSFFEVADLQHATLHTSPLGIPLPATGRNAAVFKACREDQEIAIRVFTRAPLDGPERYRLIRSHLLTRAGTVFPAVRWRDEAVNIAGEQWPMLEMEWVEGETLDVWVADNLGRPDLLRRFLDGWRDLFVHLDRSEIAHGDLQHGNVLVDPSGGTRLVDLDGMWIPALQDDPAAEYGHAHFQHPERVKTRYWGRRMDGFSALVVQVSVLALSIAPELWERYNDGGNNLILLSDDFEDHERPIWNDLNSLDDPTLVVQLTKLREACTSPCDRLVGSLEMLDHNNPNPRLLPVPGWLQAELEGPIASGPDGETAGGFTPSAVVAVAVVLLLAIILLAVWVV